ncbi:hypothetical protein ES702_05948 [subsurface metagenome]
MQYLDHPWDVSTRTSRRPTPLTYEHLRKYTALDLKYSKISTQLSLTDIQQVLNEQSHLYMPTEIRFVIAQLLGLFGTNFVTLKSTEDGALHIYPMGGSEDGKMDVVLQQGTFEIGKVTLLPGTAEVGKLAAGSASIGKVQVEGPGRTMEYIAISTAAAGPTALIPAAPNLKHHITMIVLTVAGDTDVRFSTASTAMTGKLAFGGTDEPRGMVANHGNFPLVGGTNEAFNIENDGTVLITGYLVYYDAA